MNNQNMEKKIDEIKTASAGASCPAFTGGCPFGEGDTAKDLKVCSIASPCFISINTTSYIYLIHFLYLSVSRLTNILYLQLYFGLFTLGCGAKVPCIQG